LSFCKLTVYFVGITIPHLRANQVLFSAWIGLRPSEIVRLQWELVHLSEKKLRIDRAYVLDEEKNTKTAASTRDVELLAPALSALVKQKSITFTRRTRL
jgi:integrase